MARIRVLFFAALADAAGRREASLEIADGATLADLGARLKEAYPGIEGAPTYAFAVNAEYATPGQRLSDGDEVALIPPVSGGSHAQHHA